MSNLLVLERKSSNIKLMLSLKGFNGLSLDTSKNVFAMKSLIPQLYNNLVLSLSRLSSYNAVFYEVLNTLRIPTSTIW